MAQPYIGEIRLFAGSFNPVGWEICNGQLLSISENEALFQLIGTTYGGDGEETFALPNFQGTVPMHMGKNLGQTYVIGETDGTESVTLSTASIPVHTHPLTGSSANGSQATPSGNLLASSVVISPYANENPSASMAASAIQPTGGSQPHENMQPYLCVTFIIALIGIYPTPN
ncbi:MAG TPA: tail fiber protein [Thermoanaerobaculia bacterium]|jgi:microcystin-dependent protein